MDPQSQAFTPFSQSNEPWRLQDDLVRVQQIQTEHAERIARLERRQEDDARMKSVWGTSSPFPNVLSGTPQQAPLQQPPNDHFRNFDDEATQLMSSLHLDAEDEPRRGMGATSRANSVRFDETANQNHFSHSSRPSMDVFSRTSSSMGGLQMTERTSSHKSEGRASSVHSIRSMASGRASSLNLDTGFGQSESSRSPLDVPTLAPGLMLLGAVPAIIRCWMNTNFKHDGLLYAAVCTGSYRSFVSLRLIQKLGFEAIIRVASSGGPRTVELPMFFPEAVPHPASSRSSSPLPQLPSITVEFRVLEDVDPDINTKTIQVFLGSDTLRAHNADILFSTNSMTMLDDDRHKLSIPLARPEDENSFQSLFITSDNFRSAASSSNPPNHFNNETEQADSVPSSAPSPPPSLQQSAIVNTTAPSSQDSARLGAPGSDTDARPGSRQSTASRPSLSRLSTRTDLQETSAEAGPPTASARSASSSAVWGNWRREGAATPSNSSQPSMDWANAGKNRDTYRRKETGIKVLKPKTSSRAFSASVMPPASSAINPTDGKSRFFDEGRRRSGPEGGTDRTEPDAKKENAGFSSASSTTASSALKAKSNPVGGASAFAWLNSGGGGGAMNK